MKVVGIDPGISGAICCIDSHRKEIRIIDMPLYRLAKSGKTKSGKERYMYEVNPVGLKYEFDEFAPAHIVIEQVAPLHGTSAQSAFNFGGGFYTIKTVAAFDMATVEYVLPPVWKKDMGIAREKDNSIVGALNICSALGPALSRKKDDGRADAFLIAAWWLKNNGVMVPWREMRLLEV